MTMTAIKPAVSVIVPLFNEEESVSILQSELRASLSGLDHEIIFVDDGSIDRTFERIESAPTIRDRSLACGCCGSHGATSQGTVKMATTKAAT